MGKRVLIVDDDSLLTKFFEFEAVKNTTTNFGVVSADDGFEAIALIERERPDLMVLDIRLPKADGFAVLDHIQSKNYRFPVLVLTNYDKDEYREQCRSYDIVHEYLLKRSLVPRELVAKIEQYLAQAVAA
jgi:two-component system, OmpR family, response regulator MprA